MNVKVKKNKYSLPSLILVGPPVKRLVPAPQLSTPRELTIYHTNLFDNMSCWAKMKKKW